MILKTKQTFDKKMLDRFVDELKTDRFRKVAIIDDVIYYEEVIKNEESSKSNP